jgi:hypothetical protein
MKPFIGFQKNKHRGERGNSHDGEAEAGRHPGSLILGAGPAAGAGYVAGAVSLAVIREQEANMELLELRWLTSLHGQFTSVHVRTSPLSGIICWATEKPWMLLMS